ncbi:MAG TPA: hypothetical protein VK612_09425 [Pyrinomonadaceae bacterium]|nr:hypothetical protein [Pyrinomonadaceae bacterium]
MKNYINYLIIVSAFILSTQNLFAQTSVVTYQGKLSETGTPATGQHDFTFKLFTTPADGSPNVTVIADDIQVTAGIFTVNLNFGTLAFTAIPAIDYFIEIAVRPGISTGAYTTLGPRQPLTSSPYSIRSLAATAADSLSAACVLCLTDGHIVSIDGSKVTGTVPVANIALNVAGVVGIENGRTGSATQNFVDLAATQTIGGDKTFSNTLSGNVVNAATQYNIRGFRVLSVSGLTIFGATNTFAGAAAGTNNTTGESNSYFGQQAGTANNASHGNSFFGRGSGSQNLGGSNSFFGLNTGLANTTGSSNALFGANANVGSANLSNATAIGANAIVSQSNSLVLGSNANVGIGTSAPNAKLQIAGGSVYIQQPNSLVITSPNGACWFITVNNAGGLSTIPVTCP